MPYTLGLILVGLFISMMKLYGHVGILNSSELLTNVAPEIFLIVFLPGLLFEGAMNIETEDLLKNIKSISLFAVLGVLFTVLITGSIFHYLLNVPWVISLLFASMIAPTDPVAVLAILKKLGVSKKLAVLLEGESLFNDGTGIVIFKVILGLIITGTFSFSEGVIQFLILVVGGLVLGSLLGYLLSKLMKQLEDTLIQLTLTTVLAYGSFIIAEQLHFSGVISTVSAGLVMGGYGMNFLSPQTKLEIRSFWNFFGFLLNSFVFLLIGLEIEILNLIKNLFFILIAFFSVLFGRAISIYALGHFINKVDDSNIISVHDEHIPFRWQHALIWGGLHGGLSMVLALSLPIDNILLNSWRPFLLSVVFGTVFLSLVLQGTTMSWLLHKLGLTKNEKKKPEFEQEVARIYMYGAGEKELNKMLDSKIITKKIYQKYIKYHAKEKNRSEKNMMELIKKDPILKQEQIKEIESSLLYAYKNSLTEGSKKGLFSESTAESLLKEINKKIFELSDKE